MVTGLAQGGGAMTRGGRKLRSAGFTLIELLVVIAIIALLIAITIPSVIGFRNSAKKTATIAQMRGIQQACESYHNDFNSYPGPVADEDINGAVAAGYSSSQNMLLGLSLRWYPVGATIPATATAIPGLTGPQAVSQESTMTLQPISYSAFNKPGPYSAYLNFKQSDLALDAGRWPLVDKLPMLADTQGFKTAGLPILYFRLSNKWNPDRGSGTATPTKGFAGTAPVIANATTGQACFYTDANSYVTSPAGLTAQAFTPAILWNMTDSGRANLNGIAAAPAAAPPVYVPRGGFVLISAGLDRQYGADANGNSDDLIMEGGGL